ncbi:MAG: choice-of-anchor Q domain-containing protein, partial [Bacteroidota bacterium]|nr:choice-of-anchor Q domain-containing protein [Bacteroidota bacterium]
MKRKLLNVFFLALIMQIFSNFSIATNYIVSGSFYMDGLYIESGTYNGQPNISTSDPLLLSLADNGGSTKTFSVQDGSPVINSGLTGADIPIKDQRGYYRNGISNIGAYEYNGLPCLPTSSIITQTACSSYTINDSIYTQTGLYT